MVNYDRKLTKDKKGFVNLDVPGSWESQNMGNYWHFSNGDIRKAMQSIF
jgi:hypothetical protein